ncbi:MAG TPA: DUF367 family protein [Candidatus Bathyarchaeia archaeon]|nr:DUF367 family protein [Candidatus Bathyarchaeia archaeon]
MYRRATISKDQELTAQNFPVRLLIYDFYQDDPRKCTSAKLRKFRYARPIFHLSKIPRNAIVLNPASQEILLPRDRVAVQQYGLVGLDCSWKKSEEMFARKFSGENRRLPPLLAGNPTNYGTLGMLSTVEALSSALIIIGFKKEAEKILSLFNWGSTFLSLNEEPLKSYSNPDS